MKIKILLFLLCVTSLYGNTGKMYYFLDTYYPELSGGHNPQYLAMIYTSLTDRCQPAAIIIYQYETGSGIHIKKGTDYIVIYKLKSRIYAIDNKTFYPTEVPYSSIPNAIQFYWQETLQQNFTEIKVISYKSNQYWYN